MTDYREVHHGFDILRQFFSDKAKMQAFTSALDNCVLGAADEAIGLFNQWWNYIQNNTYIASVSEHDDKEDNHGRLSMWRAFGSGIARVALVFKIPWITPGSESLKLLFSPVAYHTADEVQAIIYEVIHNIGSNSEFLRSLDKQQIVGSVFNMLLCGVTCQKHEGFQEEREWRAIYSPKMNPSDLMKSSSEIIQGIPQIVYQLPLDVTLSPSLADLDIGVIFDRLIIDPSPYPVAMSEAFVELLTKAGVPEAHRKVVASHIPIRG
jgi:hypothetical protein